MKDNKLTDAEEERLYLLIEEAGEVIQAASKILRHGYYSFNPFDERKTRNITHLEKELGHLMVAVKIMCNTLDISLSNMEEFRKSKMRTIREWLHHQPAQVLED